MEKLLALLADAIQVVSFVNLKTEMRSLITVGNTIEIPKISGNIEDYERMSSVLRAAKTRYELSQCEEDQQKSKSNTSEPTLFSALR